MASQLEHEIVQIESPPAMIPVMVPLSGMLALNIGGAWNFRGVPDDVPLPDLLARARNIVSILEQAVSQQQEASDGPQSEPSATDAGARHAQRRHTGASAAASDDTSSDPDTRS